MVLYSDVKECSGCHHAVTIYQDVWVHFFPNTPSDHFCVQNKTNVAEPLME